MALEYAGRIPFAERPRADYNSAMQNLLRRNWVAALVAVCFLGALTLAESACAVGPEVRDNAGLFSAPAVKQADETIRNIQKNFRKELLVETFASVPESRTNDYARNREDFFASFVRERAQEARLDGIYVLVMKEPPPHRFRIQVGVGQATRERAFLPGDRDQLVALLQSNFRNDKYDEGLRSSVAFVERTLRNNLSGQTPPGTVTRLNNQPAPVRVTSTPPSTSSASNPIWSLLILGMFIVGGVIFVIFLIRMLRGGMGGGGSPGSGGMLGGGGGGGGGFFSSLLGGIGGAMAGSWLYDRFFSNHHAGDNSNYTSNPADAPPSDVGGDFASSGGDVDGSSTASSGFDSGGDFGSSGGDIGGGGGDFGGGGGDA